MRRLALTLACLLAIAAPAAAQTSWGVGITRNGALVFCDRARQTVWKLAPDGRRTALIKGTFCHAVATGLDGVVYGEAIPSDVSAPRGVGLWRVAGDEPAAWIVAPTRSVPASAAVAHDAEGRTFIWDGTGAGSAQSAIRRLDALGLSLVLAGGPRGHRDAFGGDAQFDNVVGLAAAPDGSVLVGDSGDLRRVSAIGAVTTEAVGIMTNSRSGLMNLAGLWGRDIGIAAAPDSTAVIVDSAAGRVFRVDRSGRATVLWAPSGLSQRLTAGRWGWRPSGVAVLGRTAYVVDEWQGPALLADVIGSPRVLQIDDAGHVTEIASIPNWIVRVALGAVVLVLISAAARRRR